MFGVNDGLLLQEGAPIPLIQATAIIDNMLGQYRLMSAIMLNCGLHPRECVNLRVRHFCRDKHRLIVPNAAGFNVRSSFVPVIVYQALIEHTDYLAQLHADDLYCGFGQVSLPDSFANTDGRYSCELGWQWLFSRRSLSLEVSGDNREKLILERLKRRINQAAQCLYYNHQASKIEFDVDVFWKSYLAGLES